MIEVLGNLGDFTGGIFGTLISGAALFYVLRAYITQKEELQQAGKASQMQEFQGRFFNLLQHWNEFRYNQISVTNVTTKEGKILREQVFRGRDFFAQMMNRTFESIKEADKLTNEGTIKYLFEKFYTDDLKDYLFQLEGMLHMLDSELDDEVLKNSYVKQIYTLLSEYERILINYYSTSTRVMVT